MKIPMLTRPRHLLFLIIILLLPVSALPACSSAGSEAISLISEEQLSAEVRPAPAVVKEAYRFAAANPDVLKAIPCYCGCGSIGHTSNYSCYVAAQAPDGTPDFDNHALGCSICVDITQDTIRLLRQGRSRPEIRAYVDDAYGRYGSSNLPED